MNTFSDLLDTNPKLNVRVTVTRHGRTVDLITLNYTRLLKDKNFVTVDLLSPIKLTVDLLDFDEGLSGIEISLSINGLEVLPKYQHLSSNSKSYIDQLGLWEFNIPGPFYMWYHKISGQGWLLNPTQ